MRKKAEGGAEEKGVLGDRLWRDCIEFASFYNTLGAPDTTVVEGVMTAHSRHK